MKTKLLIILIILFWSLPLLAQEVDTAWVRRYNGETNGDDSAMDLAVDMDGNVYVTGIINCRWETHSGGDYGTIKYAPNGDIAWITSYNGPGDSTDWAWAIAVDGLGNVYVTGESYGSGTDFDYATIKYYADGDTAWIRRYNGPGDSEDQAYAIAVDGSGNVCATGYSSGSGTGYDYATIKYYPNGDTAWVRRYNGPGNDEDYAPAIAVDGSGNVYVTGASAGAGSFPWYFDYATIKYYSNGDTAWVRRYNGPGDSYDEACAVAVDGFGNVYVTGTSLGSGTGYAYATIKYSPNGDTAWVRRYDGPGYSYDAVWAMAVDDSNNVYVTGHSGRTYYQSDYATIKYSPKGVLAWAGRYNGPADSLDEGVAIAVDGWSNVYVTGGSMGNGTGGDYATIRYYPNGDTAWTRRYNGPADSLDWGVAIAVDDSGNVYVTGLSCGSGTSRDYATIKYYQHNDPPDAFSLLFPPNKAFTPRVIRFDWETATDPNPFDQIRYDLYVSTSYHLPSDPDSTTIDADLVASEHIKTLDYGTYYWKVKAKDNWGAERWSNQTRCFKVTGIHVGDINVDGTIDVADVVFLVNYLYTSGPAPDPLESGDVNCDDGVNIADVIFLINYLFKNGPWPSC